MASCPKCGARIKYKNKRLKIRICRRHGPVEKHGIIIYQETSYNNSSEH